MDRHFSDSGLMKTPSPEFFHQEDYEYPIHHVSMVGTNSYQFHAESQMRADWRSPVAIRDIANTTENIQQTCYNTPPVFPEAQRSSEPINSELLKLCVFQGEVSLTRAQRAEIIIPSLNGMITQPVVILPLKRKEDFIKKPLSRLEVLMRGPSIPIPPLENPLDNNHQTKYPTLKIPKIKLVNLENKSKQCQENHEIPPVLFNRGKICTATSPVKNAPAAKRNKRLITESPKQQKLSKRKHVKAKARKIKNNNTNRFENPKPGTNMPSLSPNTFWQSQPRLPQWLTGHEYIDISH